MEKLAELVLETIAGVRDSLTKRLEALEARISGVEASSGKGAVAPQHDPMAPATKALSWTRDETKKFIADAAALVRNHVKSAVAPLSDRLTTIESALSAGAPGAASKHGGMNLADVHMLMDGIGPVFKEELARRDARLADLEARLTAAEARKSGVQYRGIWADDETYAIGDLVTKGGGLWLNTKADHQGAPGTGAGWKLIVKRGEA